MGLGAMETGESGVKHGSSMFDLLAKVVQYLARVKPRLTRPYFGITVCSVLQRILIKVLLQICKTAETLLEANRFFISSS